MRTTVREANKFIVVYPRYSKEECPHQSLDNLAPYDVYYRRKPLLKAV